MKSKARFGCQVKAQLEAARMIQARALVHSLWHFEHIRDGKVIDEWHQKNLVTDEGLNALLGVMFKSATQITAWYVVAFENNHTPAAGNTYATPGFTECTAYAEATRPQWVGGSVVGKEVSNVASKATFTINASKTLYGAGLVGGGSAAATKADAAGGGTLYSLSQFAQSKSVQADDVLKVTVTLQTQDV